MLIYCLIFVVLAILAVEYEIAPFPRTNFLLIVISVLLVLFTGLRGIPVSRDYLPYLGSFSAIIHGNADGGSGILPLFEPLFVLIVLIAYRISEVNGAPFVMLSFAAITIPTKTAAVKRLSINPFLVFFLYYVHYFFVQEMTQIRNGMACSLFFWAMYYHLNRKTFKVIVFIILAFLFHNSAILYFLLLLVNTKKLNGYLYAALLVGAIILGLIKVPFMTMLTGLDLNAISNKLTTYVDIADKGLFDKIRFFNVLNTINVLITGYILGYCMWYKINDPKVNLFLKCNIISLFTYGLLMDIPSMAARFAELFGVAFPFLLAYGVQFFPFKKLNIFFIIGIGAVYLYINIFYGKLVNPYELIRFH